MWCDVKADIVMITATLKRSIQCPVQIASLVTLKKPQLLNEEMIPQVINTNFLGPAVILHAIYWPFNEKLVIAIFYIFQKKCVFRGPIKWEELNFNHKPAIVRDF